MRKGRSPCGFLEPAVSSLDLEEMLLRARVLALSTGS